MAEDKKADNTSTEEVVLINENFSKKSIATNATVRTEKPTGDNQVSDTPKKDD